MRKIGATTYTSGIPSSLSHSGQQWDFPNGWAPSQSMVVQALEKSNVPEAKALAFDLAQRWIRTNYKSFYQSEPNHMFEKYDVTVDGLPGGGGEYDVVVGFGWTNGVVLDFMNTYGDRLTTGIQKQQGNSGTQIPVLTSVSIILISLCVLTGAMWGTRKLIIYCRRRSYLDPTPSSVSSSSVYSTTVCPNESTFLGNDSLKKSNTICS